MLFFMHSIFLHSVSFFKFVKLVGHSPIWLHVLESCRNLVFRIAQLQIFSPPKMTSWTRFPPPKKKKTPLNIICPSIFFWPGYKTWQKNNQTLVLNSFKKVIFLCFCKGQTFEQSLNCERYSCGQSFNVKFNILINLSNMKGTLALQI